MPTYVYKFIDTDETIEVQQSFTDDTLTEHVHPDSGQTMAVKKVFLPVGVTFKGDGFYKNDSRTKPSKKSSTASNGDSGSSGDSKPSTDSSSSSSETSKSETSKSETSKSETSKSSEPKTPAKAGNGSSGD